MSTYNYDELNALYEKLKKAGMSEESILSNLGQDGMDFLKNQWESKKSQPAGGNVKSKPKGKFFKEDGFFDKAGGFGDVISNIGNPQFDYNWKPTAGADGKKAVGLQGWGKNLGGVYNVANVGIQGVKAFKGLQDMSDTRDNMEDLISDIRLGAGNSPTIMYDLNASQRDLLRELQRGDYDTTVNGDDVDLLGTLGDTAMGALAGLPGGLPGVIIGGVGGLANSVIGDLTSGQDRRTAELEALYQAVLESEQYHNNMRKQRAYAGLY